MYLNQALTPPVVSFDPEGLIFAVGMDSQHVRLYDLRSFDKAIINLLKFTPVESFIDVISGALCNFPISPRPQCRMDVS